MKKLLLLAALFLNIAYGQRVGLTFSCDFEAPTPISVWATVVGKVTVISPDTAREGTHSARIQVYNTKNVNDEIALGFRSEMNNPESPFPGEQWFGESFWVPSGPNGYTFKNAQAVANGLTVIMAQWHSPSGPPPAAFGMSGNQWYVQQSATGNQTPITNLGQVITDRWNDVVFHFIWSSTASGLCEVWINGVKVYTRSGATYPNVQPGPFFKTGAYDWPWNISIPGTDPGENGSKNDNTVYDIWYVDAVRVGNASSNYASVAPGAQASTPPTANAGADQSITLPINSVQVAGKALFVTPATAIKSTQWRQLTGPGTSNIVTPLTAATQINNLVAGTYTFEFSAVDNNNLTGRDTITITVNPSVPNKSPTVNAGPDQAIVTPDTVILKGTAAAILPATSIKTYLWQRVAGPTAYTIHNSTSANASIVGLNIGTYTFSFTVTDNNGLQASDNIVITVTAAVAPTVSAGTNQSVMNTVKTVQLTGTAKYFSPANSIKTVTWAQVSGPTTAALASPGSLATSVTGLAIGSYIFRLTATDSRGVSNSSTVTITVTKPNSPPTVNAGNNQVIVIPVSTTVINVQATAITPAKTIVSYAWTVVSKPFGSNPVGLGSPGSSSTNVTNLTSPGVYELLVTVTDNTGLSNVDSVFVTVNQPPTCNCLAAIKGGKIRFYKCCNVPVFGNQFYYTDTIPKCSNPTVTAGANQSTSATTVKLIGTAKSNNGGIIDTLKWTEYSGPSQATITGDTTVSPTVSNMVPGLYTFMLTAKDVCGYSGISTCTVLVTATQAVTVTGFTKVYTKILWFSIFSGTVIINYSNGKQLPVSGVKDASYNANTKTVTVFLNNGTSVPYN